MDGCNLKCWQVKAFAEHVYADNAIQFTLPKLDYNGFHMRKAMLAAHKRKPQTGLLVVNLLEFLRTANGICANHNQVLKPSRSIGSESCLCRSGDSYIGFDRRRWPDF